jgi:hypothetical protein
MSDTLRFYFSDQQFANIVNAIQEQKSSSFNFQSFIPLLAAVIGVGGAMWAQHRVFKMNSIKEIKRLKWTLFSDAKRFSFLIKKLYKQLANHVVTKQYWLVLSNKVSDDQKKKDEYYNLSKESNTKMKEAEVSIAIEWSNFIKTITDYNHILRSQEIRSLVEQIMNFSPKYEAPNLKTSDSIDTLYNECTLAEDEMLNNFMKYEAVLKNIFQEMEKEMS